MLPDSKETIAPSGLDFSGIWLASYRFVPALSWSFKSRLRSVCVSTARWKSPELVISGMIKEVTR